MSLLLLFHSVPAAATVTTRAGGGYSPTKEEWEYYLKIWHERRRERLARRAADNGLRAELKEALFPRPPPKPSTAVYKEPIRQSRTETRLPTPQVDPQIELRLRIAELLLDLRKRTKAVKAAAKKAKKKKRDEEALMALLH